MSKISRLIAILFFALLLCSAASLFFGYGPSFGFPMRQNCSKYDVKVCKCVGILYDQGKDCLGWKTACNYLLDSCATFKVSMNNNKIASFGECIKAGYPVQETYPRRCVSENGTIFTEDIGNEQDKSEMIQVDNPRPNATIKSPLSLNGRAKGSWFFEGIFSIVIKDGDGKTIGTTNAVASTDWMTNDFVEWQAVLESNDQDKTGFGQIFFYKANPSGESSLNDYLYFPLKFQD